MADLRLLEPPLRLFLVAHQLFHRVPHRVRRRVGGEERDEDELIAEVAELLERERVPVRVPARSEEHTSELQSQSNLVCRLLLEKKKKYKHKISGQTTS